MLSQLTISSPIRTTNYAIALLLSSLSCTNLAASANTLKNTDSTPPIINQQPESISTSALTHFADNPPKVKQLITLLLTLANQNLGYKYGAADPKAGGMDCSGTVFYSLTSTGITDVPRSSDLMYQWVWQKGHFYPVNGSQLSSFEFERLKPGDLLVWSGTYKTNRDPNISHVMIYLGKNKQGQPLMVGASDGRTYKGRKIYGVSVFDFQLPTPTSHSRFLGYSCIPGINCPTNY